MPATYTKDNITSEMYILYKNKIFAPSHCAIEWNISAWMNQTLYEMLPGTTFEVSNNTSNCLVETWANTFYVVSHW